MSVTYASFLELSIPASDQRALVGAGPLGLVYREGESARKLLLHAAPEALERIRSDLERLPDVPAVAPVRVAWSGGQWVALTPWAGAEGAPVSPPEAAALLDGLAALHQAGLVHGHLSPPNVRRLGEALRLFDCALWTPPAAGLRAGAWQRLASPERLAGRPPTPADDCFAFGRLLEAWWGDADPAVAELIAALCHPDPAARPAAADAAGRARALVTDTAPQPSGAPSLHGTRFGPYRVVRTLGQGGMGIVHLAVSEESGEAVALKTVTGVSPRMFEALRWECRCLQAVRHPGVARLLAQGVSADGEQTPWYAMELVRGEPMRQRMSRPPGQLSEALATLCDTLAWLHGEGIVHGDLKPENVLITDAGRPVLVDFGLASLTGRGGSRERLAVRTELSGSVPYMAPEQATSALLDPRVDLYALGCMIYEVWSGRPPFVGPDAMAILTMHRDKAPAPLRQLAPQIPPALAALVDSLLRKRPEQRPGYAADVADALRAAAGLPAPAEATPASPWVYRPPLLERDEPLARLRGWIADGRPLVWIAGANGVGRTRLVAELGRQLHAARRAVWVADCGPGHQAPLAPLAPALQRAADRLLAGEDRAHLLGPLGHLLAAFHPGLGPRPDAGALRLPQVMRALCHLLTAAQPAPLVVVLGDAHRADDLTLAFLAHVAEEAPDGLQVVATWRAEERAAALSALADTAPGLTLAPLSPDAVAAAAAGMLATRATPATLRAALAELSGGNPFYIAEYLRTALETGQLTRVGARWRFQTEGPDGPLPSSIEALLTARLGRASPAAAVAARVVALLGVDATLERVAALTGLTDARAFEAIQALRARRILTVDGALLFTNEQNREIAERLLPEADRADLHRRAAALLTESGDADSARLAGHWELAGDAERAARLYAYAAIDRARLGAFAQADALFERALALGRGARARYDHARFVLYRTGRYEEALAALARVLEEVEPTSPIRGRAIGWVVQIQATVGNLDAAEERMDEALALLREDSVEEYGAMLGTIGVIHSWRGRHTEAIAFHEQALSVLEDRPEDAQERALATSRIAGELRYLGETARSLAMERQALAAIRALGDRYMEGILISNVGTALSQLGDLEGCERHLMEAAAIHRETGNRGSLAMTLFNQGATALSLGQPERARPLLEEARSLGEATGRVEVSGDATRTLAEVALLTGRGAEAGPLVAAAIAAQREAGLLADLADSLRTAGRVARLVDGDLEAARRLLEQALATDDGASRLLLGCCLCELGQVDLAEGLDPQPRLAAARAILAESEGLRELAEDIRALEDAVTALPHQGQHSSKRQLDISDSSGT